MNCKWNYIYGGQRPHYARTKVEPSHSRIGNQVSMGNVPDQMINYFNTQTNLSKFRFEFDPERWIPNASSLNSALKGKKNLFMQSKFDNGTYKTLFGYDTNDNVVSIDNLIDYITTNHFTKLINP